MNISYFLRDNKAKNPQRIWAFFRENRASFKIDTNRKIEPAFWSTAKQQALSSFKHSIEMNKFLKDFTEQLESIILELKNNKVRLDKVRIQEEIDKIYKVNLIDRKSGNSFDFITFMDNYIKTKESLSSSRVSILKQIRVNVILAFNLASKKELDRYNNQTNYQKTNSPLIPERVLDFDQIDINFYEKFREYMYNHQFFRNGKWQNYKKNYIGKQIKGLKQYVDAAQEKGLVKYFKANSIKAVSEDVDSVYTDYQELQNLLNLDLSDDLLEEKVRDKYVFNCFMGFRYSDLNQLKNHHFSKIEINGLPELLYTGRNQKTDKRIEFVVPKTACHLLEKYAFEIPQIHEYKYNETLKLIAMKAGLTGLVRIRETRGNNKIFLDVPKYKLISSHTGRRSFCTLLYIQGVNIQAIMSISGHKTEKEFLKYINKDARVHIDIVAAQVRNIKVLSFQEIPV